MMPVNKTPKEHVVSLRNENIEHLTPGDYRNDFERENNIENGNIRGYHGREILELLQNADDAYTLYLKKYPNTPKKDISVLFEYKNGKLRVSNCGAPFDIKSITSLSQGNNSTKDKGEFIGNKGIGFRALLNWCDDIKIFSGDYSIRFSVQTANKYLEELKKQNEKVRESCEKDPTLCIPMLSTPEWEDDCRKEKDFDTTIELNVINDSEDMGVMHQVNAFDAYTLIFLRNVTHVIFKTETDSIEYKKDCINDGGRQKVTLKKLVQGEEKEIGAFYYFDEDDGKFGPKYAIAIPCNFDENFRGCMYTFFPILDKKSPFPLLMHSTFDLSSNRNSINAGQRNRQLFENLLDFFVSQVTKYFTTKEESANVLKLIKPIRYSELYDFSAPFEGLFDKYLETCRKYVKLQTVNDEFFAITEGLILNDDYPKHFKGPHFDKLIKYCDDNEFLQVLLGGSSNYSQEELYEKINELGKTKDPAKNNVIYENVETFDWWVRKFGAKTSLPNIMLDQKGNWLLKGATCLFPKDSDDKDLDGNSKKIDLPDWAELKILDEGYCRVLVDYTCNQYPDNIQNIRNSYKSDNPPSKKRCVIEYYKEKNPVNFKEYSAANLVSPLNALVGDDLDRCVRLLEWLFKYQDEIFREKIENIAFKLPDCDLNLKSAKKLYFGTDYGEEYAITESLFHSSTDFARLCAPDWFEFATQEGDLESLEELLIKMGVRKRPPIYIVNHIEQTPFSLGFRDYLYEEMSSRDSEVDHTFECFWNESTKLKYIDFSFLKDSDPRDVFQWLLEIENDFVFANSDLVYFKPRRNKKNYFLKGFSYLYFFLKNAKWLKINGSYFSLNECFLTDDKYLKTILPSCISQQELKKWSKNSSMMKEIKKFLQKMDVPDSFVSLPSDTLYGLLIKLSEENSREAKDITRRIYRQCFALDDIERITASSNNRTKFMNDGLVLSKNDGQFHHHSEVYFSNKVEVNISQKFLLDMPLRTGSSENAKKLFFVEKFTENATLHDYEKAEADAEFQNRFQNYRPLVYCYRRDSATEQEKRVFKEWSIHLASSISLSEESDVGQDIPDFTVLQNGTKEWVIKVPSIDFDDIIESRKNALFDSLEQILSIILKSENSDFLQKLVSFFFANENDNIHIIKKDFGDYEATIRGCRDELYGYSSYEIDLENYLKEKGLWKDGLKERIASIDFSPWNSDFENREKIKNLLNELQVPLHDFEEIMGEHYSFKELNEWSLRKCFKKEKPKFVSALWRECSETEERKKTFEREKQSLEDDLLEEIEFETLNFDAEETLSKAYNQHFGQDISGAEAIDVDALYSENFKKMELDNGIDINGFFKHNAEYKSLLFFDVEPTKSCLKQWIEEKNKNKTAGEQSRTKPLPKIVVQVVPPYEKPPERKGGHGKKKSGGTVSSDELGQQALENEKIGMRAEKIVYSELKKIIENVPEASSDLKSALCSPFELAGAKLDWRSGNAEKEGKPNCDDALGYDMEICGPNGETLYIEVKGSRGNKCAFFMSDNEVAVASEKGKYYRVIFVGNVDGEPAYPSVLPSDFLSKDDYYKEKNVLYRIFKVKNTDKLL